MRQVTSLHRTLVVLAVGLLALAAPLIAYANNGGPGAGENRARVQNKREAQSGPRACLICVGGWFTARMDPGARPAQAGLASQATARSRKDRTLSAPTTLPFCS